ncbi:SusC/RagA family TonB-linked outer membrane protein [Chitinophaga rhizophila]|uniref:TonB-dependent receptor n=1 Tax=Chitinophaga rhizophila TaxID=2866212 RepID=A0ABS7GAH7_9BACT|nr:TonB-dependent receptor [Chitinophaga rhizophila]MBW8684672.1 TonB-dependent receptor [Chitinophaga rhizophila]
MTRLIVSICAALMLCCVHPSPVSAQTSYGTVKGLVRDEQGQPIPGVTVTAVNTKTEFKTGTQTDTSGVFVFNRLPAGVAYRFIFSSIGFASQRIEGHVVGAGATTSLVAKLVSESSKLNDVVVIGYQAFRRGDLLAASSGVTSKDLKTNPLNNAAEVLQGRLAGVQITMSEGSPGAEPVINIRGRGSITQSSEPLYVVDGIPMDNALNVLNPQDIESINVLKDAASTAIYGSRGANGVVVITTKGGRNTNGRTLVAYNMFYGIQQLARPIEMMDARDFVNYQYERAWWRGDTAGAVKRYIRVPENYDTIATFGKGIDWQDRTMGANALQSSHNVSVAGGNENTTYNLSLTAVKQDGILINSSLDRKNLNFRIDHKANNRFRFGFNARYTRQLILGAGTSDAGGAGGNRLRQYTRYKPVILPGEEEDSYDPTLDLNNAGNGFNILNPLLLADAEVRKRYINQLNLNGNFSVELIKHVTFRSQLAFNVTNTNNRSFDDTLTNNAKSNNKQPVVILGDNQVMQLVNSNVLSYSNGSLFGTKHSFSMLLGQETQKTTTSRYDQTIRYFPIGITADRAFNNLQLAAASTTAYPQQQPSSSQVPVSLASFFTTIDYNYAQRYYAKLTMRADGSSLFGTENKWGYFPSGVLSWRVSSEPFFKSKWVDDLRMRVSYGIAGNNRITPFSYRTQYISPSNGGYGLNGVLNGVYNPSNLGNDKLRWESQIARNLGVDLTIFKNRITLTTDVYYNTSKNLLLNQAIPSSTGYTAQFQNIGATSNKGLEIQLSADIIRKQSFSYSANFNISFNKNRITSLGGNNIILRNSGWFSGTNFPADYILKVGEEVGTMYGYINDGFYTTADFTTAPYSNANYPELTTQYNLKKDVASNAGILADPLQPGSPKFRDLNGDGVIDADKDRTIIGRSQPRFYGGLTQSLTLGNFDLNIFVNFVYGNKVFNANKLEYGSAYGSEVNLLKSANGRWRMIDQEGRLVQRTVNSGGSTVVIGVDSSSLSNVNRNAGLWFPSTSVNGFYSQSYAVENGSYIRINNITLGYNLPKALLSRVGISNVRVYMTANNVATITGYTGYDPDANTRRNDPTTSGVDYAAYPRARTYVMGLNVNF